MSLPSDGDPSGIAVLEGNGQKGRVGEALADPLVVQVTDSRGHPVENAMVAFDFSGGGTGSDVVPHEKPTDADGKADARVVLGKTFGLQAGQARVVTPAGKQPIATAFSATALSDNANGMAAVSGDNQTGPAGSTLGSPLVVQVTDVFGNPVPGAPIIWTPEGGGGVSASSVITDDQGKASVERILGSATGQQTTLASAEGLVGSPVTFVHTVVAGSAAGVTIVSGNDQTGPAGTRLPADLVVQLLDENGNGVASTAVTWVVAIGGGSVTPQNSFTDGAGRATAQWTLGELPGDNRLDAVVTGVGIANFKATATPAPGSLPALVALNGGNGQSGTIGTTLAIPLSVKVTTGAGGPAQGVTVHWAVTGGGSVSSTTSVTSAAGLAQVFRTLGPIPGLQGTTASVPGLTGSPVIFQSSATPGAPSSLFLSTQPSQSARNGVPLDRQPVIQLRDAGGTNARVQGVVVTAAIGEGGGELTGTTQATTDGNGQAAFGDLAITGAPGRRTLAFAAANYTGATSQAITLTATPTTTTITADPDDPSAPKVPVPVSFRVTSEGPTPTGVVTVSDGVDSCAKTLVNGEGSCSIALRTAGPRTLTATYAGTTGFAGSKDTEPHTVTAPPPPPNQPPTVDFHWSGCDDLECAFTDASTDRDGRVVSWQWEFGDGGTSDQKDPSHRYAAERAYTVKLTVRDNGGAEASATATVAVHAPPPPPPPPPNQPPAVDFHWSGCDDLECAFTDASTDRDGQVVGWKWEFGDGGTSDQKDPSHRYAAERDYTVKLTVRDNGGAEASATATVAVHLPPPPPPDNKKPHADFEVSCADLTCSFTNQSSDEDGKIASQKWEFGDDATSTDPNPSHTYGSGGKKKVTLTVTDDDGGTDSKEGEANPKAPPPPPENKKPHAEFEVSCPDLTCSFTNKSHDEDGSIASQKWEFGDDATSTDPNPSHTYGSGGKKKVTLTVTDNDGGTDSKEGEANPKAPPPPPPANTTTGITVEGSDPSDFGQPIKVNFTVTSSSGEPSGDVKVTDPKGGSCTGTVAAGTCTYTPGGTGERTITAKYQGNPSFKESSATAQHTVNPPPPANTTTTITGDGDDPSAFGASITVSFTVDPTSGSGTPGGNVQVTDPKGGGCTADATVGSCSYTPGGTGLRNIKAAYQGNSSFNGSEDTEEHTVSPPPPANTTTTITGDGDDPSAFGASITVSFTVDPTSGSGEPSGDVQVTDEIGGSCTGTVTAGSCSYTPAGTGERTITAKYQGNSSFKESSATAQHTVNPPPPANQAPVATDDAYSTPGSGAALTVTAPGVLGNDTDTETPASLSASDASNPPQGTVDISSDGSFTYTPDSGANGTDTFTYKVTDGGGLTDTGEVTIAINP